jgi:hypothetical protein
VEPRHRAIAEIALAAAASYGLALAGGYAMRAHGMGSRPSERLVELAANADAGFNRARFADALGVLAQITDTAFAEYGTTPEEIVALRRRFSQWRDELSKG